MAVVQIQAYEQQGLSLPSPVLLAQVGKLALFMIDRGCPSVTFPGSEMIDIMPDYLQGKTDYMWLETGPGNPPQTATVHVFAKDKGGTIPSYDPNTRQFTHRTAQCLQLPDQVVPLAEISRSRGLVIHSLIAVLPDSVIEPMGARPWKAGQ